MATLAVFSPAQVEFGGTKRARFQSAPGVERGFCPTCGSSLSWETTLGDEAICALHISGFDTPDDLPAVGHSFYNEKLCWFEVLDELPRFEGFVRGAKPIGHGPIRKD